MAFLLGTNIGEVLTVFLSMLFWKQSPLLSMQLLWINLVTDSLPAIALGMEDVYKRQCLKNHRTPPAGCADASDRHQDKIKEWERV